MQASVFVVDDDANVRTALQRSLGLRGYDVQAYPSSEAFLAEYSPGCCGCLVLDVRMPGMSGLQLQEKMNDLGAVLPIIFITGHGDIPMSVRAMKDGAVDFLEKPYPVEKMTALIDAAIEQCRSELRDVEHHRTIKKNFERLTAREVAVMSLLVAGAGSTSNKLIARELGISHRTVDDHRAKIMAKMQAVSLLDLVEKAKFCDM